LLATVPFTAVLIILGAMGCILDGAAKLVGLESAVNRRGDWSTKWLGHGFENERSKPKWQQLDSKGRTWERC
jgi:hypothetical protein